SYSPPSVAAAYMPLLHVSQAAFMPPLQVIILASVLCNVLQLSFVSDKDTPSNPSCQLGAPDHPLVDGAVADCHPSPQPLCLRQQVINLALGNTDQMMCLSCLAKENQQTQTAVLTRVKNYVLKRECFAKEWARYSSQQFCPYPQTCVPGPCFSDDQKP